MGVKSQCNKQLPISKVLHRNQENCEVVSKNLQVTGEEMLNKATFLTLLLDFRSVLAAAF